MQSPVAEPALPPLVPDDTPFTQTASVRSTPASPAADVIDEALSIPLEESHPFADPTPLTSADVKSDPILASLAKQQGFGTPVKQGGFRARPAPSTTRAEGLGPRMTKSAALRQGLDWETIKPTRSESKQPVLANVPGHKREGLNLGKNIASLAAPTITPRPTKASQLRAGEVSSASPVKRDLEAIAAANKARMAEETARRRQSIDLPASLSAPSIAPRANKTSLLRTGGSALKSPVTSVSSSRQQTALTATNASNVDYSNDAPPDSNGDQKVGVNRRASVTGVRSLGAPTIAPRMNRAAMLRAPTTSISNLSSLSLLAPASKPTNTTSASAPSVRTIPSAISGETRSAPTPHPAAAKPIATAPRPTKASLLRAGLGAKVLSRT